MAFGIQILNTPIDEHNSFLRLDINAVLGAKTMIVNDFRGSARFHYPILCRTVPLRRVLPYPFYLLSELVLLAGDLLDSDDLVLFLPQ